MDQFCNIKVRKKFLRGDVIEIFFVFLFLYELLNAKDNIRYMDHGKMDIIIDCDGAGV